MILSGRTVRVTQRRAALIERQGLSVALDDVVGNYTDDKLPGAYGSSQTGAKSFAFCSATGLQVEMRNGRAALKQAR